MHWESLVTQDRSISALPTTDPKSPGDAFGFVNGLRTRREKTGRRPCMQSLGNDVEQETNEQSDARAAYCSVNENPPVAGLPLENGLNQPSTDGTRKNACEKPTLEQKSPDPRCSAATPNPDKYRGGDHTDAKKNRRHRTSDQTGRDSDSEQDQCDNECDESDESHAGKMIRSR